MAAWYKPWKWASEKRNSPERPSTSLANPDSWFVDWAGGGKSDSGMTVTATQAMQIATVSECVRLLCDDIAKLHPYIYEDVSSDDNTGRVCDVRHPAYRLLRRKANSYLTAGRHRSTMLYHALMHGNGYSWITRNGRYDPDAMLLLDPVRTSSVLIDGSLFYTTYINNEKKVLADYEVFHLRGLADNGIDGLSIVKQAFNSFGLTLAAEKFGSKHFANGTKVSGVLHTPGRLSPEAARNLQASFQNRHEGLDNAHKTILLEEGAKFIPVQHTPNEAQMTELRIFQRREVASWFKIPPSKLGDIDSVSYNSLEQSNQAYLDSALDPWLCAFEEEAFDKLLSEEQKRRETHYIEFNRAALLRTALKERYDAYAVGRQWGWYTANDVLRKENEPLMGPEGDVFLSPVNMTNAETQTMAAIEADKKAEADLAKATLKASTDAAKANAKATKAAGAKSAVKPATKKPAAKKEVKATPLLESVVMRAARRLVESGRKAIVKDQWRDALADRLNDHRDVLVESLAPVIAAMGAGDELGGEARAFDAEIELQLATVVDDADSRDARRDKWDAWASGFLQSLAPATVSRMAQIYEGTQD